MDTCIVCKMFRNEMDAAVLYRDDHVIAIMDHNPLNLGHVLICPTQHYVDFDDVPEDVLARVMAMAQTLYRAVKATYAPDGLSMMQNNGAFNELKHYHLHIFPRYKKDNLRLFVKQPNILNVDRLKEEVVKIRRDLPVSCHDCAGSAS